MRQADHIRIGDVNAEPHGGVRLRVGVYDEHLVVLGKAAGEVDDGHCLAGTAFHRAHSHDPSRVLRRRRRLSFSHSVPPKRLTNGTVE